MAARRGLLRLAAALEDLGAEVVIGDTTPDRDTISAEWLSRGGQYVFTTESGFLDALSRTSIGSYEDLIPTAITTEFGDGSEVMVASYEKLVRAKELAGRDKDLADLEALREIREEPG